MKPISAAKIAIATRIRKAPSCARPKGAQTLGEAIGYGKVGVIGAIERKGNIVAKVIGDMDAETLNRFRQPERKRESLAGRDR